MISIFLSRIIYNPLGLTIPSDVGKWFFSAVFQGVAAVIGLSFVAFVFIFERIERGINESNAALSKNQVDLSNRLNTFIESDSNPDNVDHVLTEVISQMQVQANLLHLEAEKIRRGGKSEWLKEVVKSKLDGSVLVWRNYANPTYISKLNLDRLRGEQRGNFSFMASSIASLLPALFFSIIFLAFIERLQENIDTITGYIFLVLLLALYSIIRIVHDILVHFRRLFSSIDTDATIPINVNLREIRRITIQAKEDADYLLARLPDVLPG